ncbi:MULTISPECIES: helix-turn-helix domain-containing protein [unclassified Streptomyces]|jgi:AcrR family transcriptional regulator|uniref:TetR/AcrR family transcriptional regulator n=1 Tax=unclassified Streptomyces TaxID=2593676 RepID=UPI00344BF416
MAAQHPVHESGHGSVPDSAARDAECGEHPAPQAAAGPSAGADHVTQHRPMRRDAARNHQLVIAAAREVLTEYGTDASMELIASRAGVGVGTLYRRFPNKEALVDEIAAQLLGELVGQARISLSHPGGTGFEAFVRVFGHWLSEHRGYAHKLIGRTEAACVEQLRDLIDRLLDQAKASGRIDPHVELGDVMTLVWGMRGVVETSGTVTPDAWQRYTDIHLAGMRAPAAPGMRSAVTRAEMTRINAGG